MLYTYPPSICIYTPVHTFKLSLGNVTQMIGGTEGNAITRSHQSSTSVFPFYIVHSHTDIHAMLIKEDKDFDIIKKSSLIFSSNKFINDSV